MGQFDDLPDIKDYWSREDWVDATLDYQVPRNDLDAPTDEERQAKYGDNWRKVYALVRQMATLTRDDAERVASNRMTESDFDTLYEQIKAVAPEGWTERYHYFDPEDWAVDFKYAQAEVFWETRLHYLAALMAVLAGDGLPEKLRDSAMYAWTHR
ncbi:hypothetical protein K388_07100 [Streptomyces sp. KhCrAH-43]|uniref:hypothetical protein n=1 Tax=unclassified Streptomyces TaxID=2593676 RepID=UPI000363E732|nr:MULTISPECIES: hypothetical protein [unclassified Streptomyces]MYS32905.1 hypothetical protein [Streptomyces sp. SID4920]MYX64109.1 hypothetical protein [Streptomyces sp. SID8373]RAJ47863.1 hypothetical protein K388_07100 [Streptomyces sp. KhCrAH-43]